MALVLYALWPAGALMVSVRMPHLAYDMAFAATAWTALAGPRGWQGGALTGLILGLSAYVRPTALGLLPALALARIWSKGRLRGWFTETVLPMTVAAVLMLIPVMAWHMDTRGTLDVATSAYGGSSMYHGSNVESGGRWSEAAYQELRTLAGGDQWARTEIGRELAVQRWLDDPLALLALGLRKQDKFWGTERYGVRYGIRRDLASRPYLPRSVLPSLASGVFYAALTALAAYGLYRRRREPDALAVLLLAAIITISLVHALLEVRDRYHAYLIPLFMPIAADSISTLMQRVTRRKSRPPTAP